LFPCWIDQCTDGIPELRSFVLPGGTDLNGFLHLARAVCRRAERTVITLHQEEPVSEPVRVYINRLSDLLFAMARFESHAAGVPEYLWKPGASRPQ
jgi:cob(I)alamin adenosyltransferase